MLGLSAGSLERRARCPLRIQLPVGSKVPFDCTASGKVFLGSLRRKSNVPEI